MTETPSQHSIAVLGAGSWGTALAVQLARAGQNPALWGRAEDEPELLAERRCNQRYLPGVMFPPQLKIEPDLEKVVTDNRDILVCVPSHVFRLVLKQIAGILTDSSRIAWATKGFEQTTGKLPHQVAEEELGKNRPLAVLSGPTFAREVGAYLPTAMTVAATDVQFANELARRISSTNFRAYTTEDLVGVEVGGGRKECPCDSHRNIRRPGLWFKYPCRAHQPRPGRDDAPGHSTRGQTGNVHGPVRHGGPGADLYRRPIEESSNGPGFGQRKIG